MNSYTERRILVLGKTYPSYSHKHDEVSCTGGLVDQSWEIVRLHPINFRDLPEEKQFKHWQWIRARIAKDENDSRPESFRIEPSSIQLEEIVESPEKRRSYIEGCPNKFNSVEDLIDANAARRTSLGIIVPSELGACAVQPRGDHERAEWESTEKTILAQGRLPFASGVRKIDFPDLIFYVQWTCYDPRCTGHKMSFHDWGLHELSRRLRHDSERAKKLKERMDINLAKKRDLYFMLGNFRQRPHQFGLMGILSVPHSQPGLFN